MAVTAAATAAAVGHFGYSQVHHLYLPYYYLGFSFFRA